MRHSSRGANPTEAAQPMWKITEPVGDEPILGVAAYIGARCRMQQHDLILREYMASGITIDTLAKRLKKPRDTVEKWIACPCDLPPSVLGPLIFAMRGGDVYMRSYRPLSGERPPPHATETT